MSHKIRKLSWYEIEFIYPTQTARMYTRFPSLESAESFYAKNKDNGNIGYRIFAMQERTIIEKGK